MALIAIFLIASSLLPSSFAFYGPGCPNEYWLSFKQDDGVVKCYITGKQGGSNYVQGMADWCENLYPGAVPAIINYDTVKQFIQEKLIRDNEWYNIGYYSDRLSATRDYNGNLIIGSSIIPTSPTANLVLKISRKGLDFFEYISGELTVCTVTVVPMEVVPYEAPPPYISNKCPDDSWTLMDVGYTKKCFKEYRPTLIIRCRIVEVCTGAHPSALPASIRNDIEKDYLISVGVRNADNIYTGIHIPCYPEYEWDSLGNLLFVNTNNELLNVTGKVNNNYRKGAYSDGKIHESIMGYSPNDLFSDLPDRVVHPIVLCEIFVSEHALPGPTCPPNYVFFDDYGTCNSIHILAYDR